MSEAVFRRCKIAATIGHIDAFDENVEQWTTSIKRFGHFVRANDISDEKQVAVFLSVMGSMTYSLLRSLIAPEKPGNKTFDGIVEVLQTHFSQKPLVIDKRFRFHKRNQEEGESVTQYVTVLKKVSEYCEFGTHLDDAIRVRFVCGLK